MKLLEKYKKHILELFEVDHFDNMVDMSIYEDGTKLINKGNTWDFWWRIECLEEKYNLHFALEIKKQFFLELIEYYMKKGLLKFKGTYSLKFERRINEKGEKYIQFTDENKWDENTSIKDTIAFFDKHFPTEDLAKKSVRSLDNIINTYLYANLPAAYWFWKDPADPNDKGQWYACDNIKF